MAFEKQNFSRITDAMNGNVAPATGASGSLQVFSYRTADDAHAAVAAAGYFLSQARNIKKADIILVQASDSFKAYHVTAASDTALTVVASAWVAALTIP